eukprot:1155114-Pelagomonas_calceolata.AAC.1
MHGSMSLPRRYQIRFPRHHHFERLNAEFCCGEAGLGGKELSGAWRKQFGSEFERARCNSYANTSCVSPVWISLQLHVLTITQTLHRTLLQSHHACKERGSVLRSTQICSRILAGAMGKTILNKDTSDKPSTIPYW